MDFDLSPMVNFQKIRNIWKWETGAGGCDKGELKVKDGRLRYEFCCCDVEKGGGPDVEVRWCLDF